MRAVTGQRLAERRTNQGCLLQVSAAVLSKHRGGAGCAASWPELIACFRWTPSTGGSRLSIAALDPVPTDLQILPA